MAKVKFTGKVISHHIFFNRDENEFVNVPEVQFYPDTCGMYYIKAVGNEKPTQNWRRSWEELEIVKVADGLYHMKFYAVSSPCYNIRSEEPFMVLEMTKDQVCNWHSNDVWFEKGYHYIIRREGKKFYQNGDTKRCIKCQYQVAKSSPICDNPKCEASKGE